MAPATRWRSGDRATELGGRWQQHPARTNAVTVAPGVDSRSPISEFIYPLARELVPHAINIGILTNLQDPKAPPQAKELEAAARAVGVKLVSSDAVSARNIIFQRSAGKS